MIYNIPSQTSSSPWWLWLIIIILIIVLLFLIWWWLGRSKKEEESDSEDEAHVAEDVSILPDNLELVEGIGPKIAALLKTTGIMTFKQLAATDVGHLNKILDEANLRIADPESWPEQARLAAEGKMDELLALQNTLKGGRKVG